jgi:hypothetical protein
MGDKQTKLSEHAPSPKQLCRQCESRHFVMENRSARSISSLLSVTLPVSIAPAPPLGGEPVRNTMGGQLVTLSGSTVSAVTVWEKP